jgi:survival-of-motor-neuron-related-splicing factor 30
MAAETLADLEKKLAGYRESYRELEDALKADPGNEALISLKQEMHDVISMTEDMIKIKKAEQAAAASKVKETPETNGAGSAPQPPTQSELKVGSACWAQWSVDGLWYEAVIDEVKPNGDFLVTFVGYGNSEVVFFSISVRFW